MVKTVLIDDEQQAREGIRQMLDMYAKNQLEIIGEADSVASGLDLITNLKPELVFLDIKMSDGSGFDLLTKLKDIFFDVIFTTAFHEYAIKAFKYSALDYLLKPIDPNELKLALNKVIKKQEAKDLSKQIANMMAMMNHTNEEGKTLVLKTSGEIFLVKMNEIIHCESDSNYTRFYMENKPTITVAKSLKHFEDLLYENGFVRLHKSHVVNLKKIKKFSKDDSTCVMSNDRVVPVSIRRRNELLDKFQQI